jgi:hypothetical protein
MHAEPPANYEPVASMGCDCTPMTLRLAITKIGPAFCYHLTVAPQQFLEMAGRVRMWTCAELAFVVNVYSDPELEPFEWYLQANDRCIGSKGG